MQAGTYASTTLRRSLLLEADRLIDLVVVDALAGFLLDGADPRRDSVAIDDAKSSPAEKPLEVTGLGRWYTVPPAITAEPRPPNL